MRLTKSDKLLEPVTTNLIAGDLVCVAVFDQIAGNMIGLIIACDYIDNSRFKGKNDLFVLWNDKSFTYCSSRTNTIRKFKND